jgi:O-acetyl-ADP-ribose deacetylase (regulator of RNase III)
VNLHLVDPKSELCAEWEKEFATLPNVTITQGKFEQVETYECLINAGNSFGIMDGGVDLAIARFFPAAPTNCQRYIVSHYAGEQPVGTSFITRTGNTAHPYIAHTPTMRVPENIAHTDNVYYAMRAALMAIKHWNGQPKNHYDPGASVPRDGSGYRINNALVMGLGTATGKVPYAKAAYQMALAYTSVLAPITTISWQAATRRHNAVRAMDISHQPVLP